jgi:antitoxin (DNA-binding transcriptional repressor) of toxin-antitoxin stability system
MRKVALSDVKDDLSRYLRLAAKEELVITRHGRAAGILIGFGSEDDWFDYRLENDPRFLDRIASARASLRAGRGVRLEDVTAASSEGPSPNRGRRPGTRTRGVRSGRGG